MGLQAMPHCRQRRNSRIPEGAAMALTVNNRYTDSDRTVCRRAASSAGTALQAVIPRVPLQNAALIQKVIDNGIGSVVYIAHERTLMTPTRWLRLPVLALILAAFALAGAAQDTAQIQGTLSDDNGAALPGVPLGTYSLRYEKTGFTTTTVNGIVLQIGTEIERHDVMKVQAQAATVE